MNILKRIRLKFWRTISKQRHRYTIRYAKLLGMKVADNIRLTRFPYFGDEPWLIEIGSGCIITQNVRFMTHDGSVNIVRSLDEKYKNILKS